MVYLDPQAAAVDALDAAAALANFGVALSDDGRRWLDQLRYLQANRPPQPPHNRPAELIAHGADEAQYNAACDERERWPGKSRDWQEAERIAGGMILAAIRVDAGRIHNELRALADDIIANLHAAARLTQTVTDLVRARRHDEAAAVANAPGTLAELESLYDLRDLYLTPPAAQWSTGMYDASRWENPWDLRPGNRSDETQWGFTSACIRSGGRLWFPRHDEATTASRKREPSNLQLVDPQRRVAFAG